MSDEVYERSGHRRSFEWGLGHTSKFHSSQGQSLAVSQEAPQLLSVPSSALTASIVSAPAEILDLTVFVSSLVPEPAMLAPRFFLASLLPGFCRPCVVVVARGRKVAGLLYAQERLVAGIPTSIVLADDTLGAMVVARPEETESVLQCALETLLKHKAALRFRIPSKRLALLQAEAAKPNAETHFFRQEFHAHIELARTYDEFLAKFRSHTRHNFCRYRHRSELAGNEFCPELSFADFCAAAKALFPKEVHARHQAKLRQYLAMIDAMPSRILVGLRRSTGQWISLAGGWYAGDCAILNMQLNDHACARESVSVVLRSYLIEQLIERGIRELVFWAGTSPPLSHYISHREEYIAYVDSRSHPWRLVRLACVALAKLAPAKFGKWLKWEAPEANGKLSS